MVWRVTGDGQIPEGVYFAFNNKRYSFFSLLKWYWYKSNAKALICCNKYKGMRKLRKEQVSLYLSHGSKIKKTKKHNYCPGTSVDYINVQSHFFDEITCSEYETKMNQLIYLGYPRCDWFYVPNEIRDRLSIIGITGDYIIWLPTFRKHVEKEERNVHSKKYDNLGIPLLYSEKMILECNDFLKGKNLHIIYKPHPVQDISTLLKINLSNIHVIDDKLLNKIDVQLYQVIAESKALISDYSSVYFDYLLLNRPIATTIDDIEEWKQGEGFAYDVENMCRVRY